MAMFESLEQFRCGSVFDRYSINQIAIGVKHNKYIFVATEGGYWIAAWEISSNEILEFFVQRSVDYFNGDVTGLARRCAGYWGSVLASLGGGLEERMCFHSICMCPFVVGKDVCRRCAALGSVRWDHPRK